MTRTSALRTAFCATLIGSVATLAGKAMYQETSFANATFTGAIFVSLPMALNWPLHCLLVLRRRRQHTVPLLNAPKQRCCKPLSKYRLLLVPAVLDLSTSVLLNLAFERTAASSMQMVTSAGLVVVAILARVVLKTRHTTVQWAGVAAAAVGLACVGGAAELGEQHGGSDSGGGSSGGSGGAFVGVLFAAASTVTAGLGWVLEERYLKAGIFEPMEQVGVEGTVETLVLIALVLPAMQASGAEDVLGALHAVATQPRLLGFALAMSCCLAAYNPLSQAVARQGGSVLRMFAAACRVVLVWAGGLALWAATHRRFGEGWNARGGWLELVGFGFLCLGLVLFARGGRGS